MEKRSHSFSTVYRCMKYSPRTRRTKNRPYTFSTDKVDQISFIVTVDMEITGGTTDRTGLKFRPYKRHELFKQRFWWSFYLKKLDKQRVFSYHSNCVWFHRGRTAVLCRTQILFWHCMWIALCEEKERTLVGAVLSLIFLLHRLM